MLENYDCIDCPILSNCNIAYKELLYVRTILTQMLLGVKLYMKSNKSLKRFLEISKQLCKLNIIIDSIENLNI